MNARNEIASYEDRPQAITPATPMQMLQNALASGASVEMMEKLLALQERWEANNARKAFDAAMAAAKAEIPTIARNRTVDHGNGKTTYKHEDLAEIAKTVTPILAKHGLSYRFRTETAGGIVTVTCVVSHRDGHAEENQLSAGSDPSGAKNAIQAVGSTITYLQRYTLKAALGLAAAHDDDGKASEPVETISEDQRDQLRDLIEAAEADAARLAKAMKVASISEIPASRYEEAIQRVRNVGRQNGKDL